MQEVMASSAIAELEPADETLRPCLGHAGRKADHSGLGTVSEPANVDSPRNWSVDQTAPHFVQRQ